MDTTTGCDATGWHTHPNNGVLFQFSGHFVVNPDGGGVLYGRDRALTERVAALLERHGLVDAPLDQLPTIDPDDGTPAVVVTGPGWPPPKPATAAHRNHPSFRS